MIGMNLHGLTIAYPVGVVKVVTNALKKINRKLPRPIASQTALILTMIEANVLGRVHHDVILNPFPDLNAAMTIPSDALPTSP